MISEHRRRPNRIPEFDYSQNYAYFLTICTDHKQCILGTIVKDDQGNAPRIRLSKAGELVDRAILGIPEHYSSVKLEHYVVMPNHVHILLRLENTEGQRSVTVATVVQQWKGFITKQLGKPIWQKLYYDHVIRDPDDFAVKWRYIDNNPARWMEDKYFIED